MHRKEGANTNLPNCLLTVQKLFSTARRKTSDMLKAETVHVMTLPCLESTDKGKDFNSSKSNGVFSVLIFSVVWFAGCVSDKAENMMMRFWTGQHTVL